MTLQSQAKEKIEAAFVTAEAHYDVVIPRIPVVFSNRMTKSAGNVRFGTANKIPNRITLSTKIMNLNPTEFMGRTPEHEAAHVIELIVFGRGGHGVTWKHVMRVLGKDPERCHNMFTPPSNRKPMARFRYVDTHGTEHMLTKVRHNKIMRGGSYRVRGGGVINDTCYSPC